MADVDGNVTVFLTSDDFWPGANTGWGHPNFINYDAIQHSSTTANPTRRSSVSFLMQGDEEHTLNANTDFVDPLNTHIVQPRIIGTSDYFPAELVGRWYSSQENADNGTGDYVEFFEDGRAEIPSFMSWSVIARDGIMNWRLIGSAQVVISTYTIEGTKLTYGEYFIGWQVMFRKAE
jgi:hypothetical protein